VSTFPILYVAGAVVVILGLLAFRLFLPRQPRLHVDAVSEYWLQQLRGTSGDNDR
jgi:hypothetical protein